MATADAFIMKSQLAHLFQVKQVAAVEYDRLPGVLR